MNTYTKIGIVALTSMIGFALPSFATVQDFESYTGTDLFVTTSPSPNNFTDVNGVTFNGGAILTDTANLPMKPRFTARLPSGLACRIP